MTRTAADLTQDERKRIVAGQNLYSDGYSFMVTTAALLDIHEDTVRQVLREEGE